MISTRDAAQRLREVSLDMDPDDMDKELFMEAAFMIEEYQRFVNATFRQSYVLHNRWSV